MTASSKPQVNIKKAKAEMKLIGFLLGRKVAKKNARHVPSEIDTYHTLPLRSLHRVAMRAYSSFKEDKKETFMAQMSRYFSRLRSS